MWNRTESQVWRCVMCSASTGVLYMYRWKAGWLQGGENKMVLLDKQGAIGPVGTISTWLGCFSNLGLPAFLSVPVWTPFDVDLSSLCLQRKGRGTFRSDVFARPLVPSVVRRFEDVWSEMDFIPWQKQPEMRDSPILPASFKSMLLLYCRVTLVSPLPDCLCMLLCIQQHCQLSHMVKKRPPREPNNPAAYAGGTLGSAKNANQK